MVLHLSNERIKWKALIFLLFIVKEQYIAAIIHHMAAVSGIETHTTLIIN